MNGKKRRQEKILEIIEKIDVTTQEELVGYLKEAGYDVTQATVSRDIKNMQLTKVPGKFGGQKYAVLQMNNAHFEDKYVRVLRDGYVSMDMAQNILVMKTLSGMAMAVAAAIDSMKFPEIVGCIAGDDTIMMAVRTVEQTQLLMEQFRKLMSDT